MIHNKRVILFKIGQLGGMKQQYLYRIKNFGCCFPKCNRTVKILFLACGVGECYT